MKPFIVITTVLLAAACGGSPPAAGTPAAGTPAGEPSQAAQLGGQPTGAGSVPADAGEIQPADPSKFHKEPGYSPYAGRRYPERPYFGDEHVHTSWSVDAGGTGTTLGPEEATRFARGEEVTATSGQPVKLGQPLDWVAITDHSDMMGMITEIKGGNPEMMADPTLKRWRDMFNGGPVEAKKAVMELVAAQAGKKLPPAATDPKFGKSVWARNTTIAEKYNEPGRFTAFIGYEWTSNAGGGDNLHRNIIYRDNKDKADTVLPYTTFQSENPEDLYQWMSEWEKTTGGKILAIAHNGNLSNGRMFALTTFSGDPLTKAWADARQRWEPLFEAIQMKGQSESHPSLSPTDDFAAYELWDRGNLTQTPKKPGMIVHARQGRHSVTQRYPWTVAFTFGLLHGFGFASALAEVGLPGSSIPIALLFFNVGVEIGQLLFVGAVLAVIAAGSRAARRLRWSQPAWLWRTVPYAVGALASFWLVERVAAF